MGVEALLTLIFIKLPIVLEYAAMAVGAVAIVATIAVKFTSSVEDDAKVGKWTERIWNVIGWLPTIGVNPKTKKLQEIYDALTKAEKAKAAKKAQKVRRNI